MKHLNFHSRHSLVSLQTEHPEDPHGNILISEKGQHISTVRILHSGVDTIRQLYKGVLSSDYMLGLQQAHEKEERVTVLGHEYAIGGALKGGYQYRLQDNELGVIIMLKSRYRQHDTEASHLKIELSPGFILARSPAEIQQFMDEHAAFFFNTKKVQPAGSAVHLAVDVQGWQPPADFLARFVTRTKRMSCHNGISDAVFDLGAIASVYNQGETFTFGKASGLQFTIYNKTKEARFRDKLHFWEDIWSMTAGDEPFSTAYEPEQDVWRLEVRFHQSIIREYGVIDPETGEDICPEYDRFIDLAPHIKAFWQHATLAFRLDHSRNWIDPDWQIIHQDPDFQDNSTPLSFRRFRKKPGEGSEKNICLALGNLLTLYARNNVTSHQAIQYLEVSGIWHEITAYYAKRGIDEIELEQLIRKKLQERRMLGKAA